jgi:hypothetical protein
VHGAVTALQQALIEGATLREILAALVSLTAPTAPEAPPPSPWAASLGLSLERFAQSGVALGILFGRQSGKTQIAAALAAWEAVTAPRGPGATGQYGLMIAQDYRGALRALFSYAAGVFDAVPLLMVPVVGPTTDSLTLRSGITLAAYPCRPPAIRGRRAKIAVLDKLGFYRNAEGNPQDVEMLRAVRPTLATTGGRLVILSSPAGQQGALWDLYRGHFARDAAPVHVWRGSVSMRARRRTPSPRLEVYAMFTRIVPRKVTGRTLARRSPTGVAHAGCFFRFRKLEWRNAPPVTPPSTPPPRVHGPTRPRSR